ncbi:MAG: poly-gamma-glutamate system protein [Candidatus Cloacimonadaceae bacterium]|nr:poly-gamma-glutamate system protein [Candidatus Cloacimonadaceae bacterium]MDP3114771.1 poly-gamma-glutamate system protein [Candidatus Cloacimonadaceae bacterium]
MYRPSLKSSWSLVALFVLSVILFVIAQNSYVHIEADFHDEKVEAAKLMSSFIDSLRTEQIAQGMHIDPIDDPFQTGLIGSRLSSITTDRGLLSEKQAAVNPNIAAIFIDEFSQQKLTEGDYVAIGITGSNPSVNLALYAALKVMKLNPRIIVALSSASYGANREDFTWLDIETVLKKKGMIDFGSSYASFGGKEDLAIGLSDSGFAALRDAMKRNGVPLLIGSNLEENVDLRDKAYLELIPEGERYKLFVNIGGGLANVGSEPNARLIPEGINNRLAEKQFEKEGIMMVMASKNVPILHVRRIMRWAKKYDISSGKEKMPEPGVGAAFSKMKHNVTISAICLLILMAALIVVILLDRHDRRFMANIVDPDEEI